MSNLLKKHNSYKPLYKKFTKLKENIQDRKKIFNFKKKKWEFFIQSYIKKLKRYNKFKPYSQTLYKVFKFSTRKNSYKKRYLNTQQNVKNFKLFYGGLKNKSLKKNINIIRKKETNYKNFLKLKLLFLERFENRLDTILYRSKFSFSIRNARQLISHGKIFVNQKKVTSKSFTLKSGDFISIDNNYHSLIKKNIKNLNVWPLPPKNLMVNYRTLQIIFRTLKDYPTNFFNNLNLEKIIN